MRAERSSKVTASPTTPHRPCARSSRAISSVSTFHDHSATPAASVAIRKRLASHTEVPVVCPDIVGIPRALFSRAYHPAFPLSFLERLRLTIGFALDVLRTREKQHGEG